MKKYEEILTEINTRYKEIVSTVETNKELRNKYSYIEDWKERYEKEKPLLLEIEQNKEKIHDLKLEMQILRNNAKIALFYEVMPCALEILKKYKNKPYGEKTRDKICAEIKEETGCRFYIRNNLYVIYPKNDTHKIECGMKYIDGNRRSLLVENKIQEVAIEELEICYASNDYVRNTKERVMELKTIYEEALSKRKELDEICSKFNELAVEDIPSISAGGWFYDKINI